MKYRHKLVILLVAASLAPMTVLVLYSHVRMSAFVRQRETEDMQSILDQSRENIDSQIAVYASLLNYLTYAPDIEEIIQEKNVDAYTAYRQYTEVADPLLSVPKSYHAAIREICLYAESIPVEHEHTLAPLKNMEEEWWYKSAGDDVRIQWIVDEKRREIAAVRKIYDGKKLEAALCMTLDYDKMFQPFDGIIEDGNGVIVTDSGGTLLYRDTSPVETGDWDKTSGSLSERLADTCAAAESVSGENGWKFYLFRSKAVISGAVSGLVLEEIPLILVCAGIILILGILFSRLFTRKIEALTRNMEQVNAGSRQVTVYSDEGDEVGILIRTFRRMMDEINRLIDEVYGNRIALKEYELKALQAQINPHFLYNTLSSINWMAIRSGQKEISRVTLALSTFYRTALSKGEDMVTVESCIQNIRAYLEIQSVMHDHDFRVEWRADASINQEKVPKLLLQPVVENALEHGLDMKEEGEKVLSLSFLDEGSDLAMVVRDNGPGMEPEKAQTLLTYQSSGFGLKNVNDRIQLLYGEAYQVKITSVPGQGTTVEIRLPKREGR